MKILLFFAAIAALSSSDLNRCVLELSGASAIEELDESELERYQHLADHPLEINTASRSRLLSSGLFSVYQVASIIDCRTRTGDILSGVELSLLDGFTPEFSKALAPFVSFASSSAPGQGRSFKVSNTLTARFTARKDEGGPALGTYAFKESLSIGQCAELNWDTRITYSERRPEVGTVSAAYYGKGHLGKIVLGHFNARFGQGLAMWSGFSISGAGTATLLRKNPSGIAVTTSFSPALCGVATDWNFGRWSVSAACSFPFLPILNISRMSRNLTFSLTATDKTVSGDWRWGSGNCCFFGEVAWDGALAAVSGLQWTPSYGRVFSACGRYYSPGFKGLNAGAIRALTKVGDEAGVSAAYSSGLLAVTADACVHPGKGSSQMKGVLTLSPEFELGSLRVKPSLRANLRFRPQEMSRWRNSIRSDLDAGLGPLCGRARLEFLKCKGLSWLTYAELGYGSSLSAFCRWTLFKADNWDDRIYVYERDAPGTFNVPAYYGRGWGLSFYVKWKISRRHSLYLRASTVQYRWMEVPKPSRTEGRLQYRLSL